MSVVLVPGTFSSGLKNSIGFSEPIEFAPLKNNFTSEVIVVGEHMSGQKAAYLLLQAGNNLSFLGDEVICSTKQTVRLTYTLDTRSAAHIRQHDTEQERISLHKASRQQSLSQNRTEAAFTFVTYHTWRWST